METFKISKIILECRREKAVTQKELADHIGVSKASVSKWERGQSFPDITLLPLLASYFNISIDELMGYEPEMTKDEIKKLYLKLSQDFSQKPFDEVMENCQDIVKRYFSFYPVLFQVASLYINNSNLASDMNKKQEVILKAQFLLKKIRLESEDLNLKQEAVAMEAYCLLTLNQAEEAIELLKKTNTRIQSNGSLLSKSYQRIGENEKAKEILQIEIYQFLINFLQLFQTYISSFEKTEEELKDFENKYNSIAAVFKLKNLRPDLAAGLYLTLAQEYMKLGNKNEALFNLKKYTDIVTENIYPLELKGDEFFTLIDNWLESFSIGKHTPRNENIIKESMYRAVENNPIYQSLKDNRDFQNLIKRLEENFIN